MHVFFLFFFLLKKTFSFFSHFQQIQFFLLSLTIFVFRFLLPSFWFLSLSHPPTHPPTNTHTHSKHLPHTQTHTLSLSFSLSFSLSLYLSHKHIFFFFSFYQSFFYVLCLSVKHPQMHGFIFKWKTFCVFCWPATTDI